MNKHLLHTLLLGLCSKTPRPDSEATAYTANH